jgi:uncharacterized protein (DUF1810 family)
MDPEPVLRRILECQDGHYATGVDPIGSTFDVALHEIRTGRKQTHWMWYVWPTLKGTRTTKHPELELPDLPSAVAYLAHPELRRRLLAITAAATAQLRSGVPQTVLFGKQHKYDAPKFHEVCTCFLIAAEASNDDEVIQVMNAATQVAAGGERHVLTAKLMGQSGGHNSGLSDPTTLTVVNCQPDDHDADICGTVSVLGDLRLYRIRIPSAAGVETRPSIAFHFVIDNSGSMGHLTKDCTRVFGELLGMPGVDIRPGSVTSFQDKATVLSRNVRTTEDMQRLVFPPQGNTNITAGICDAVDVIATSTVRDVIHIMVYLSDGGHNCGDRLTDEHIAALRKRLDAASCRTAILVVGISNNDTSLGMKVKAGLESITINALESVYFARTATEMRPVLDQLIAGCTKNFAGGRSIDLQIAGGHFMETLGTTLSPFVSPGSTLCIPARSTDGGNPQLLMNGQVIDMELIPFNAGDVGTLVDSIMPQLRRLRVANGVDAIRERVRVLEGHVALAEEIVRSSSKKVTTLTVDDIGSAHLPAVQRLAIHRAAKQAQSAFAQQRAELRELVATLANDSAAQASFLSGGTRKYATKAVLRADMVNTDPADIVRELVQMHNVIEANLAKDQAIIRSSAVVPRPSVLSLLSPIEQFTDWLEVLRNPDEVDLTSIYSHLVALGFTGVPATFVTNNAVQVDPLQTDCLHIEPTPIDSATLSLALQMDRPPRGPMGETMETILILVDPQCPSTSLHLMRKTLVYKFLTSVALCKDLYMFNYEMTLSMHIHGLAKAVQTYEQTKSTAYLELCIRILYSLRKFCNKLPEKYAPLFARWWSDLGSLTRATEDDCPHPMLLPVLLGIMDEAPLADDPHYPMLNFLNECLARKMRGRLMHCAGGVEVNTHAVAESVLQEWCGINATNCPLPHEDILVKEPPREEVMAACQAYLTPELMDPRALDRIKVPDDIQGYVCKVLNTPYRTFQMCHAFQTYLKNNAMSWDDVIAMIEFNGGIPTDMTAAVSKIIEERPPMEHTLDRGDKMFWHTMFIQATLCHDTKTRSGVITMKDVHDPVTLRELIVELRMGVYEEACKVKMGKWRSSIGELTLASAQTCDVVTYEGMIGQHTHGHCRAIFIALALAGLQDERKREIFLERSNACVKTGFGKIVSRASNKGKK